MSIPLPEGLLAELTHRCPLHCPYCSNPLELTSARDELDTETWCRVFKEARELGVLQLHLSGGEPTLRSDLSVLIREARHLGLYTNLITSGVLLDEGRLEEFVQVGLQHVQLSLQDSDPASANALAAFDGHRRKLVIARCVRSLDRALTLNVVLHRLNIERVSSIIDLAVDLDAQRLELAHTQYHGWAKLNSDGLLPSYADVEKTVAVVEAARVSLRGRLVIDQVLPDYWAQRPKACMGGWGRRFLCITPDGTALPCHAAQTLPNLHFESVKDTALPTLWHESEAFRRYRGTSWMKDPCRSCDRREQDWGGCRCQAFALSGDASQADPACSLSSHHRDLRALADASIQKSATQGNVPLHFRR